MQWREYEYSASVIPKLGGFHQNKFRVQGGIRSYAAGLAEGNLLALYKNDNGYTELTAVDQDWSVDTEYRIGVKANGNQFEISVDGVAKIVYIDEDNPYLNGMVGFANRGGSHTHYSSFRVIGSD